MSNERYDISPQKYGGTKWDVIDLHNNNCPIAQYDTREQALKQAITLDRKGKDGR